MNESIHNSTVEAVVKESARITPESTDEVRQITLQIDDPSFRYMEGQSIGVVVPGPHHFGNTHYMRRYSITNDNVSAADGVAEFSLLVKRCFYIDEVNGEQYPGIASNYLCDASPGDKIALSGPYKSPFKIPPETTDNILMIGTGTGIAPFRVFIQNIYREKGSWQGNVRLFYGATSGMDLLYMNDLNDDLANYYDERTFQAFCGLESRPLSKASEGLERSIADNAEELWSLIQQPNTYVYLAGLKDVAKTFNTKMAEISGSENTWETLKKKLTQENRLSELLYT
ncbi:MAG: oxidoreductase [Gammaproteobacteria bacterium]|nr:oxidoreductase [Gammaproteobacteria bacterium]